MRPVTASLAMFGGFAISLGLFVGGMGAATYLIAVEEKQGPRPSVDVADLWTSYPRRVEPARQNLERLPARNVEAPDAPRTAAEEQPTDAISTASVRDENEEELARLAQLAAAHVAWCRSRYRSYDEGTDSYTSYMGEERPCVSPVSKEFGRILADDDSPRPEPNVFLAEGPADLDSGLPAAQFVSNTVEAGYLNDDHVRDCFNRYRSYRPEDNSYQPHGGGPRRQCN